MIFGCACRMLALTSEGAMLRCSHALCPHDMQQGIIHASCDYLATRGGGVLLGIFDE
jgi:hypothetical protein